MAKDSLSSHEPETLLFVPLLMKALKIFRNHIRILLYAAFTLTALPLLTFFSVAAFLGGQGQPGTSPRRPAKLSPAGFLLLVLTELMSAAASVALIAAVVHVVIGDHLGRTPGNLWLVVRRSFWRLAATLLAKFGVLLGLLLAMDLIGGCAILLLVLVGNVTHYPILFVYVLLILITTPIVIVVSVNLALAEHATAIEGAGIWGFEALRRSWALCEGTRSTVYMMASLDFVTMLALGGPLNLLAVKVKHAQPGLGHGLAFAAFVVAATVLFALVVCLGAYFKVAWCLVYLSARKKTEPEFGLTTLLQYFEADSSSPEDYDALTSVLTEEV
eukprot:TRINITY_DN2158_c0_g4_i1.p1 TRINITY_DN2158_c0_g4~~TRINITY_DN2158_c0_g4_i1.p1  ORF type:complete len:330 (-),score=38.34 TRINITY_DN2158_c0_g4_i1:279-1268(-)